MPFDPVSLGIPLILTGVIFFLAVWLLPRRLSRLRSDRALAAASKALTTLSPHDHGVLLVQAGGKVEYLNDTARNWLNLHAGERPNLEWLAKHIRPSDDFLRLCTAEGQVRFSINGRPTEAVSYLVPGQEQSLLISMVRPDLSEVEAGQVQEISNSTLKILTDLAQSVAASPSLSATIQSILENLSRLVPADLMEIKIWKKDNETLIPYRLGSNQQLEKGPPQPAVGYSTYLVQNRELLFIPDLQKQEEVMAATVEQASQHSYIGLPLLAGNDLIGTLETGLYTSGGFKQEDLNILQLVVGQASAAIRNASMLEAEQRRSTELSGLANLAQALGSTRDAHDLYARLIQSIAPLFDAEILGLLVFNEGRRALEAQVPFVGMPTQVVELYHVSLAAGSQAEECFLRQDVLVTHDAMEDPFWRQLGFQDYARAASWRDAALIPLISSGRALGYLQISNHRKQEAIFTPDEMRLLSIVANQIAPIIDNLTLVQQVRQRALRSEALRRIASLAVSSATTDEVMQYTVQELARLLQANMAAIFLLDENRGVLRLHKGSIFGLQPESLETLNYLDVSEPEFHFTVTGSSHPILVEQVSTDARLLQAYRNIFSGLGMESALVVPLVVREHGLGELMLASKRANLFNNYDLQVVLTASGQLASVVEGASLSNRTDESLRLRVDQLTAITRINKELNTSLEWKYLLQVVYDESLRLVHADCGSVLLLDPAKTGAKRKLIFQLGDDHAAELTQLEKTVIQKGDAFLVQDFSQSNFESPHADIRSGLVVPIGFDKKLAGIIHLHSHTADHFNQGHLEIIQTLAVEVAIALENLHRFQEETNRSEALNRRAEMFSRLFSATAVITGELPLEKSLETLASILQETSRFQSVNIGLVDPETKIQNRVAAAGVHAENSQILKPQQAWESMTQFFQPEYKVGLGYRISINLKQALSARPDVKTIPMERVLQNQEQWDLQHSLIYPLFDGERNALGVVALEYPDSGKALDGSVLETIEVFITEIGLLVQNSRKLTTYRGQVETLSASLGRSQQLLNLSQGHLPTLLHKDLEQMISIRNLDASTRRIRAGLEITEAINRQVDGPSALKELGREILTKLEMSVSITAENTFEGPRLMHVLGNIPRGVNPEALFGQRNPLRTCLQTGEAILVMNLEQNELWRDTPLLTSLHAKGFICLPINIDEKTKAAVLATNAEPLPPLTQEDEHTYLQISQQVSIILQNISLLNETRRRLREVNLLLDFSRQLSGLDTESIVKALLESARRVVSSAHAGVVLLYDNLKDCLAPQAVSGYASADSLMEVRYQPGEALPGRVFSERKPLRVDEVNFARDYSLAPQYLLRYREATGGRLPVSSMLIPIQTSEKALGVLLLDNFNTSAAFSGDDEALLLSLTQQVALSLENVRLVQASQERAAQLQALTGASAEMVSSLNSSDLVAGLLESLHEVLPYDTAILWLRQAERMSIAAVRGFPDNEQRLGLSVTISDSVLLAEMNRTSRAIVVDDVRTDARFPSLVQPERLSWLGIPLVSKGEVVGVIALEKKEANFFNLELVQLVTTFAGQASVALENSSLYEESLRRAAELDERSQRLALLNRLSSDLSGSLNDEQVLRLTAEELQRAISATLVSMVTFDRFGKPLLRVRVPSGGRTQPLTLHNAPIFERLRESLGVFTSYQVEKEIDLLPLRPILVGTRSLLILPLVSGQNLRALAFIQMENDHHFSAIEIDLARIISNQAAIALESARLYQATVSRAEQLTTLNRASYEIGLSLDPEQIYAAIHRASAELMPVESFVISLVDEAHGDIEGVYLQDPGGRVPNMRMPLNEGISGQVIGSGQPLLVEDASQVSLPSGKTYGDGQPHSIVAVPITMGGKVIGMLSAQSYEANVYGEDEQQILSTLANQAAVAIQNGRLFAESSRLADELEQRVIERTAELAREQRNTETLLRILTEASSTLDLDRALNRTLALLNDAIGAEQGSIMMVNPEDNSINYRAGYGFLTPTMTEGSRPTSLKVGEGLAGWVIKQREALRIDDVRTDKRWVNIAMESPIHRSVIAAPLIVGEEAIGAIMVYHRQTGYFTNDHMALVKAIGIQAAVAINNAQLYILIRDQAERLGSMLRNQQVEASRQQAILEAVADGVLVTDPNNIITFLNTSAERIMGIQTDAMEGQSLESIVGIFGKAAQSWMQTIHSWSEDPSTHQPGDTYAEQLTLETGHVVLVHLAPVIWRNDFLGTVSIFRDITHEVEVDRLKSEFVATVSHELRTPMTSIKGYVDILLMGAAGALNENQTHFLDIVRSNTDRLSVLVNDLLDISRIEAGRVSLSLQAIDLHEVAEDVMSDVTRRSQEENKPMVLNFEAEEGLPRVTGDIERVRQILGNLVDNAYHYTQNHGQINISMKRLDANYVQVDVQDNGIGIDSVDSDRIFERFFRGEHPLVLATPGTGLGLAIVKQLITMHKGRIWMKSKGIPGEGSIFSFTLPVYRAEE